MCVGVLVASALLPACGVEQSAVDSPPSSNSALATVSAPSSEASDQLCGDDGEPPAWPISTVEGLAISSDLAGWAGSTEDLGEAALPEFGLVSAQLVTIEFETVLRGDRSARSVVVLDDEFGPQLVSVDSSIVFLVEIDDPALAGAVGIDGPIYSLTPGVNSVLDVVGDVATSRCGEFFGLVMSDGVDAETVVDPVTSESVVVASEAVTDSYPVDDVVRIVSDPALGPKPDSPELAVPLPAPTSDSDVEAPTSLAEMEAVIPVVEVLTGPAQSAGAYFGRSDPSGGAAPAAPGFSPAVGDELFCWAVEVINGRPQPVDEYEEVVVASEYFSAIEPFAVAEAVPHLQVLIDFTSSIAAQGSFTEADEVGEGHPAATAFAAMNVLVDRRCLGLP